MNEALARELLAKEIEKFGWPLGEIQMEAMGENWLLSSNVAEEAPRLHLIVDCQGNIINRGETLSGIDSDPYVPFAWFQRFLPFRIICGNRLIPNGRHIVTTVWEN